MWCIRIVSRRSSFFARKADMTKILEWLSTFLGKHLLLPCMIEVLYVECLRLFNF